jgi:hypothetical protein
MDIRAQDRAARLSLIAATATGLLTGVHHVYRLGLEVLVAAVLVTVLPYLLLRWFRKTGRRAALSAYAVINGLVFVWFGFIDGFLDHVLKAVGLDNATFLPGGEADVVDTAFSLWSPAAGNAFYDGTGVLTFIASTLTMYFTFLLLRDSGSPVIETRRRATVSQR